MIIISNQHDNPDRARNLDKIEAGRWRDPLPCVDAAVKEQNRICGYLLDGNVNNNNNINYTEQIALYVGSYSYLR